MAPEVRIYLGEKMNWFVGPQFLAGGFNLKPGDKGYQGEVLAGRLGRLMYETSAAVDVDFTLGVGYGHLEYDSYRRIGGSQCLHQGQCLRVTVKSGSEKPV